MNDTPPNSLITLNKETICSLEIDNVSEETRNKHDETVERFLSILLHIVLISIFESIFFFLYITEEEKKLYTESVSDYFEDLQNNLRNSIEEVELQYSDSEYINAIYNTFYENVNVDINYDIDTSANDEQNNELVRLSIYISSGLFIFWFICVVIAKLCKYKISYLKIFLENIFLIGLLMIYQYIYFTYIILEYIFIDNNIITKLFLDSFDYEFNYTTTSNITLDFDY